MAWICLGGGEGVFLERCECIVESAMGKNEVIQYYRQVELLGEHCAGQSRSFDSWFLDPITSLCAEC